MRLLCALYALCSGSAFSGFSYILFAFRLATDFLFDFQKNSIYPCISFRNPLATSKLLAYQGNLSEHIIAGHVIRLSPNDDCISAFMSVIPLWIKLKWHICMLKGDQAMEYILAELLLHRISHTGLGMNEMEQEIGSNFKC